MRLTIALSIVFVLAIGVTWSTPIGHQLHEHHHHGNPGEQHPTPRIPELYELIALAEPLVNDTFENEVITQNLQQTSNGGGSIPVNVFQTPETELPAMQTPLEPQNATRIMGPLETNYPSKIAKWEYVGNNAETLEVDVENYTSIHGNCSHCMEEFRNATSIKNFECTCSLFTTEHPTELDSPKMSKLFENVSCHESVPSEKACIKHCIFMATAYNQLSDDRICDVLQHASSTTVYLQAKLCERDSKWIFTGMSSPTPICCHMGAKVPC